MDGVQSVLTRMFQLPMVKGKRVRHHTAYPFRHEFSNLMFGFFKTQISVELFLSSAVLTVSMDSQQFPFSFM